MVHSVVKTSLSESIFDFLFIIHICVFRSKMSNDGVQKPSRSEKKSHHNSVFQILFSHGHASSLKRNRISMKDRNTHARQTVDFFFAQILGWNNAIPKKRRIITFVIDFPNAAIAQTGQKISVKETSRRQFQKRPLGV